MSAATGITGLDVAINTLNATSTAGNLQVTDTDGAFEATPGLVVERATTAKAAGTELRVSAVGTLLVKADAKVQAGTIYLRSEAGNLTVKNPGAVDSLTYLDGVSFVAAGSVDLYKFFAATNLVEYRSGKTLQFGTTELNKTVTLPSSITSNTIIIESGETLVMNGTLKARDRLELVSDKNVYVEAVIQSTLS
jgi:hypothetical protein